MNSTSYCDNKGDMCRYRRGIVKINSNHIHIAHLKINKEFRFSVTYSILTKKKCVQKIIRSPIVIVMVHVSLNPGNYKNNISHTHIAHVRFITTY